MTSFSLFRFQFPLLLRYDLKFSPLTSIYYVIVYYIECGMRIIQNAEELLVNAAVLSKNCLFATMTRRANEDLWYSVISKVTSVCSTNHFESQNKSSIISKMSQNVIESSRKIDDVLECFKTPQNLAESLSQFWDGAECTLSDFPKGSRVFLDCFKIFQKVRSYIRLSQNAIESSRRFENVPENVLKTSRQSINH